MSFNANLVLVKGITVTFINRQLVNPIVTVNHIVDEAVELSVPKGQLLGEGNDTEVTDALKTGLDWLRERGADEEVKLEDILSTIRIATGFDSDYLDAILETIGADIDDKDDEYKNKKVQLLLSQINHTVKRKKLEKKINDARKKVNTSKSQDELDSAMKQFAEDVKGEVENKDGNFPGFVGEMSSDEPESIDKVLEETKKLNSDEGTLMIPLQGMTKGLKGIGIRRGDMYCAKARSGKYKSGHLLDLTMWLPHFNKPHMLKGTEKQKPLILRVSFENTPEQDINTMYTKIKEHETKEKVDISKIDTKEARDTWLKYVQKNGYSVAIICFDPNRFDVWKLIDVLTYYENQGYAIHAVICDYLEIIAKANKELRMDTAIASAFEICRNHCMPKRISFFTAHQFNTAAGDVEQEVGTAAFAKKMARAGGIYDHNCRSLIQKLDVEVCLNLHGQDDRKYLAISFGKLRERVVDEKWKHFYYEFQEFGGIVPDFGEEESKAIYSLSSVATANESSAVEW